MTPTLRLGAIGALLVSLAGCDSVTPATPPLADARGRAFTTVPVDSALGTDIVYEFHTADGPWDGAFSVASFDEDGALIVSYRQEKLTVPEPGGKQRYTYDFRWDPALASDAVIRYLTIPDDEDPQATVLHHTHSASNVVGDSTSLEGNGDRPTRSYHTMKNGDVRVDYPKEGDPFAANQQIVTSDGVTISGATHTEIRLAYPTTTRKASYAVFSYPDHVTFTWHDALAVGN